ncbi:hypothetical protein [Zobellia roscoffensis]|uniref:hypothetical protein n=1 Tax=Zobellia roscoffensis TaxID=2779508 RepID=UPI00188C798E|nr:hypothetical protein [Zobellia roscoffensis]
MAKNNLSSYIKDFSKVQHPDYYWRKLHTRVILEKVKDEFQNPRTYQYLLKKTQVFLSENKISGELLIRFLESFARAYSRNHKPEQGLEKFILSLKKSPKLNSDLSKDNRILLRKKTDILSFLEHKKEEFMHLDIGKEDFIKHIHSTYSTGYTYQTLRRTFYDL